MELPHSYHVLTLYQIADARSAKEVKLLCFSRIQEMILYFQKRKNKRPSKLRTQSILAN
jgi:hypothetical protein